MFGLNDSSQNDNESQAQDQVPNGMPSDSTGEPVSNDHQAHDEPPVQPLDDKPPEPNDDDLINLKEQALNSLSPLLNHLDQTPEEHFKTLMMLIQASDNSGLIKEAYEAATKIQDEKSRAQALLDVVNEINYFTQKEDKDEI